MTFAGPFQLFVISLLCVYIVIYFLRSVSLDRTLIFEG